MPSWLSVLIAVASVVIAGCALTVAFCGARAHKRVATVQLFGWLLDRLEDSREDRGVVRSYDPSIKDGEYIRKFREASDRVSRAFDIVGLLDRTGYIDHALVDRSYSVPFVLLYEGNLGKHITEQQAGRGTTHFWELVQLYERVQYVPDNHPGFTHELDWPRDARQKPKTLIRPRPPEQLGHMPDTKRE